MPFDIGFVSLGCAKNLVDSQIMAGVLLNEGLRLAPAPEQADVLLVNTCAFIESAREESAQAIHWACAHKRAGGCRAVIVAGCMAQRYRARMHRAFPDVDAFLGLDQLDAIADIARRAARGERQRAAIPPVARRLYHPRVPAVVFSGGPHAYLKVAEGCNHRCAFCAIPAIRGRQRSRTPSDLVKEARALLEAGFRELNLIAQDVLRYGADLECPATLAGLLRELDAFGGAYWLRLLYGYPGRLTADLLETLANSRHVCRYLDLPIQHSHPAILRAMRRSDTINTVPGLTARLRQALPGVTLRTTCLVGFPGETEQHFNHLLDTVKQSRFDHLGVFVFSPEDGTLAAERNDIPPAEVAAARRDRLMRAQRRIVREQLRARIGDGETVLLERPLAPRKRNPPASGTRWIGRIAAQAPEVDGVTRIDGLPDDCRPGQFIRVRINGAYGYDLRADYAGAGPS